MKLLQSSGYNPHRAVEVHFECISSAPVLTEVLTDNAKKVVTHYNGSASTNCEMNNEAHAETSSFAQHHSYCDADFSGHPKDRGAYHAHFIEMMAAARAKYEGLLSTSEVAWLDQFLAPSQLINAESSTPTYRAPLSIEAQCLYARLFNGRRGPWLRPAPGIPCRS
jgi:hypothetical protein